MSRPVTVETDGHVLKIGVDRAHKRNAWNRETIAAVADAVTRLSRDDDLRVGVLFGHGEHFSAGLDLADVAPALQAGEPFVSPDGHDPFGTWAPLPTKPMVLALQGICFTLSIELALAADIVVAADDCRFGQIEIARGIMPFGGATFRAAEQLGWGNAMRYLLTADEFDSTEAHRIGLVQEVVAPGEQLDRAVELATRIAAQAPLGVRGTLMNARVARDRGPEAAKADLFERLPDVLRSEDAAEGVQSFLERRPGRFVGR